MRTTTEHEPDTAGTRAARRAETIAALREDRPGPLVAACTSGCDLFRALSGGELPLSARVEAIDRAARCTNMCRTRRAVRGSIPGDR